MSISMPQHEAPATKKPRRMPASQKRIEANRRNARRSTGPRTAEGKKRSAQNGRSDHSTICSVDPSVTTENDGTFHLHVADMHRIFKPRTALQLQLFPQLCALQWTLDRMIEAEAKIYQKLAKRPDEPPCEIIARVFVENPTRNPLVAFERYWRLRQAEYWRLVKEYDRITKRPDTVDPEEQWQWDEARRLQEERERRMHGEEMARRAAEARAEAETGLQPVQHGLQTHAEKDTPVTREPTLGDATGDTASESPICTIVEEKTKPLGAELPGSNDEVPDNLQEGKSGKEQNVRGASVVEESEGDGGRCPPYQGEATLEGGIGDNASKSPICAMGEEKTKPLHRGTGASGVTRTGASGSTPSSRDRRHQANAAR